MPNFKWEHAYNEWGETLYLSYNWDDATQQWIYNRKTERSYDANGNITSSSPYTWDVDTEQWIGIGSKYETTYDENNNIILNSSDECEPIEMMME